ncbi:hypothetical protein V6R21_24575 [Limibacter armeniacum]|uniref:DUF6985 domain-containing protein n=1 Tax=Limibacter armeniacum TaxID=466084 RepID=UPI002FE6AC50
MKDFKFSGNWSSYINLHHFDTYYSKKYSASGVELEQKQGNEIKLVFADEYQDFDPDPKKEQINTINFLLDEKNQLSIIESIIGYLKEVIYPYYKEEIFLEEEYPQFYPEIVTIDDFQRYFRLYQISIYTLNRDNQAYYCLYFDIKLLDSEHGLSIEVHKDRSVDHGASDGTDGYIIAEELNLENNVRDLMHQIIDNEKPVLHKPDPKYGVLKPWQIDSNDRFAFNAYRTNEDDLLVEYINSGIRDIGYFKRFYELAKKDGREKIISALKDYEELN